MYPTFHHQSFESNRMNCKLSDFTLTTMLAAVGMVVMAGTASAQDPIPGEFFAFDGTNTVQQDGGAFSDALGFGGLFRDGSGAFASGAFDVDQFILVGGNSGGTGVGGPGTGGFQGFDDESIVTTLTGLEAGTYDVRFIYTAPFGNGNLQYATGFAADATTQLQDTNTAERYLAVDTPNTPGDAFGSFIGSTTVGADGTLQVFTDALGPDDGVTFNNGLASINGLSLVQTAPASVPEPGSVALLLGLGGLGLIRRRKF